MTAGTRRWSATRTCSSSTAGPTWPTSAIRSAATVSASPELEGALVLASGDEVEEARQDLRPDEHRAAATAARNSRSRRRRWCSTTSCGSTSRRDRDDQRQVPQPRRVRRHGEGPQRDVVRVAERHRDRARRARLLRRARHLPDERRCATATRSTATPPAGLGGCPCRSTPRSASRSATTTASRFETRRARARARRVAARALPGRRWRSSRVIGGTFHMWYIFGTGWRRFAPTTSPDRIYKIGHATSPDGIAWRKEEGRPDRRRRLGDDESQALPTVIEIDGRYHMFFCYRRVLRLPAPIATRATASATPTRMTSRTGRATTTTCRGIDVPATGTPTCSATRTCSIATARVYLLYNGNEFGRYGFGVAVLENDRLDRAHDRRRPRGRSPTICGAAMPPSYRRSRQRVDIGEYARKISAQRRAVRSMGRRRRWSDWWPPTGSTGIGAWLRHQRQRRPERQRAGIASG